MTEGEVISAAVSVAGTLFGVIAWRELIPRILRWRRSWRTIPPGEPGEVFTDKGWRLPEFKLPPIRVKCPQCGTEITMEISGGYDRDAAAPGYATMPLGQRLLAERLELVKRREAFTTDPFSRADYSKRIAAIDAQLKEINRC